jgi:hypothetical protein
MKTNLDELLLNKINKWEILSKFIDNKVTIKNLDRLAVVHDLIENKELMSLDCDLRTAVLMSHINFNLFATLAEHGYVSLIKEILNPANQQFNCFLNQVEFDRLYPIIKKYCNQEQKNLLIKYFVNNKIDHGFKLTEYSGDCNEVVEGEVFYFNFFKTQCCDIDSALSDIRKNKQRLDLSLKQEDDDFVSSLTRHYSFGSRHLCRLLKIFPKHSKMPHILSIKRGLPSSEFNAEVYVLKNWEKEKNLLAPEQQLEVLSVFFNLTNPKCPFLKYAEQVCEVNNISIVGYVYKKENLDFLKQNFNFSFIHKGNNPLSFFSREYGGEKRLKYDARLIDVYNLLKIEPRNCLFVDLSEQPQYTNIYTSLLEKAKQGVDTLSKNEKTYVEIYNFVTQNKVKYTPMFLNKTDFINRSHLIDLKYFNQLMNSTDLESLSQQIGVSQKNIKKVIFSNFVYKNKVNFTFINLLLALKNNNYNYDRMVTFLSENKVQYNEDYNSLDYFVSNLKKHFSEEKCFNVLKMIQQKDVEFLHDIAYSLDSIGNSSSDLFKQMVKDLSFKNIKQLHDEVSQVSELMSQARDVVSLKQEAIESLDGKNVLSYVIKLPETNFELIKIGQSLNLCVGNGGYFEKVMNNESFIISLNKNDKYHACIEIDTDDLTIKQAKLFANKDLDNKTKGIIKTLLDQIRKQRDKDE